MIGAFVKWYGCTFDYALYGISFSNLLLYGRVIPYFGKVENGEKDNGKGGNVGEVANANNPKDWKKIKDFYRKRKKKH
jgi:hypothetical protein